MAIKKSELYSSLWQSCDELRGGMDASQYKDYVLTLLFIKYISDKYAGRPYAAIEVPPGASFKDMVALKGNSEIGDQINKKVIARLANANQQISQADFPDFNDPVKLGDGKEKVERLTNLIAIFENKALDFSKNRADGDDILGDAYEYLMRHFATESGKSKGQFYTPAEVSRVIAQILGIRRAKTSAATTVYDPTCGSGSLLLKVADEAGTGVTIYGQEKDAATSGLARMNMVLHGRPTAAIVKGNTLTEPQFGSPGALKMFDYVVANPPFSDKRWSTGLDPQNDPFERFRSFGEPPAKQGDYAYAALRLFKQRAQESGRMDRAVLRDGRELLLGNLELIERHGLKRAACLLFSDRPEKYVSGAWIKIGFFVTDDDLRYQDEIHGNLFEQVEKTLDLLQTKYLKAYISYHGLQRRETFLFPDAALREALLNAVVHKDYSSGIPIQISVYDDQIVLWNPGDLPENWTLARLLGKHPSCPYNPLIANAFFRVGYIESWGRGIQKIQRECKEHGIEPPVYDFGMAGLLLTFRANPEHLQAALTQRDTTQETAQETAQETDRTAQEAARTAQETAQETDWAARGTAQETVQERVLALLRAHPLVTRKELASRLGLSDSGIKYHLEKMKAAGVIRRVGATKSGYWEVVK